jgi:hypothetical protein
MARALVRDRVTLDTYVHRAVESQNQTAAVTFARPAVRADWMVN